MMQKKLILIKCSILKFTQSYERVEKKNEGKKREMPLLRDLNCEYFNLLQTHMSLTQQSLSSESLSPPQEINTNTNRVK